MSEAKHVQIDDMPVSILELSARARNALARGNITTCGELRQKNALDLLRLRSLGRTTLREIQRQLGKYGLALRGDGETNNQPSLLVELRAQRDALLAACGAIAADFPNGAIDECGYRVPGSWINAILAAIAKAGGGA